MGKPKGQSQGLAYLQKVRPEALKHLLRFFSESARHLDPKTRFLISVVTKVIGNSPRGVRQYVERALKEGATPDEVIDAVLCAYPCSGLARVVDALDVILDMGLPGFEEAELVRPPDEPAKSAKPNEPTRGGSSSNTTDQESPGTLAQVVLENAPKGWIEVGNRDELADGKRLRVLAGSHDVALFNVGGRVFAIDNRCPHTGGPLSEGYLSGDVVTCPLHAWKFQLSSGLSPEYPGVSVRTYAVKVEEDGRVLLNL